ncbi:MAG: hypothetical protein HKN94_09120 [Acidimicrobiales bacterium]|nr:hypothetical protein [Acidimicrobiales bacterium]
MRSLWASKPVRVVALALVALMIGATAVAGQESTSPDLGTGWELRLQEPMPRWSAVASSEGRGFVVRALDDLAFWSADGLEWQAVTDAEGTVIVWDLAASDAGFVVTKGLRQPEGSVLFSSDGLEWENASVGRGFNFWRVNSGPRGFLVAGDRKCESVAHFSSDGRQWAPSDLPSGCISVIAAQLDDRWVALTVGADDFGILTSTDGVVWSEVDAQGPPRKPGAGPEFSFTRWVGYEAALRSASLTSDGETLVLAGKGTGGLWVSMDGGTTWTDAGIDDGDVAMTASDFGFVGVGPERVLVSTDGIEWIEHRVDGADFHDVAAIGTTVVATAADGIYVWTAPEPTLPLTGRETLPLLVVAAALIGAGLLATRGHQRLNQNRS